MAPSNPPNGGMPQHDRAPAALIAIRPRLEASPADQAKDKKDHKDNQDDRDKRHADRLPAPAKLQTQPPPRLGEGIDGAEPTKPRHARKRKRRLKREPQAAA